MSFSERQISPNHEPPETHRRVKFDPQLAIGKMLLEYPENVPIAYRHNSGFLALLGISHETLNNILTIARAAKIIPGPFYQKSNDSQGKTAFLWRDEIVNALNYLKGPQQEDKSLRQKAKRLRSETKSNKNLTLGKTAAILGVNTVSLKHAIAEDQISLKSPALAETVKRIGRPTDSTQKLIDEAAFQKLKEWTLGRLTLDSYRSRRQCFLTVSEITKLSSLHLSSREIPQVAEIIAEGGIPIATLPHQMRHYWVLSKTDQTKALEIVANHPELAQFKANPVQLIAGPAIDPLPTIWQLRKHHGFLPLSPVLREFGIKIGGGLKNTIERSFVPESPVSILGWRNGRSHRYFYPKYQQAILEDYVRQNFPCAEQQKLTLAQIYEEVVRNPGKFFLVQVLEFDVDVIKTGKIAACTNTHKEVLVRLAELRQQGAIDRYTIFGERKSQNQ